MPSIIACQPPVADFTGRVDLHANGNIVGVYRGVKERSLAITYGVSRESVEEIIREKVAERTSTPCVALRKAA